METKIGPPQSVRLSEWLGVSAAAPDWSQVCAALLRYLSLAKRGATFGKTTMAFTEAEILEMKAAALPLMVWLANNCHPHVKAIVDSELVEVMEGLATAQRVERYGQDGKPL